MNHEASNSRVHLPGGSVTALAEKHRRSNHRPGCQGRAGPRPQVTRTLDVLAGARLDEAQSSLDKGRADPRT